MRLLMTTDTVGGVWTFTCELSEELLRRGHAVALVSFGKTPSVEQSAWALEQQAAYGDRFQLTASTVPLEWTQENQLSFSEGEPVLTKVAEQFQPDLLLANQLCFGATSLRLPRVVVAHSDVLSWARACKLAALTPTPWLNQYTMLVQGGLLQADALIAPTQSVLQGLTMNFFLPSGGSVIPNGRRLPTPDTIPERKLQAVSAGRLWDEAKGLDLLGACDLPLPVLVAGETSFDGESAADPPANVRLLGPLSSDQLQTVFRESAMYLCTSRYEPFGLAPLEAALCGCAIVARDLPSLREVWGDDALYFRDAEGLTAQVRSLSESRYALPAAQERAGRRAAQYSVERLTDTYLAVFEAVIGKRGKLHVA